MLHFKPLTLDDIDEIRPYFHFSSNRICDNTVGGTFMWRTFFSSEYAIFNETLIFKAKITYYSDKTAFSVPLGKDIYGSIEEIKKYCAALNIPIAFCTAADRDIDLFRQAFRSISLLENADWNDYLYRAEDLMLLSGRKYNGQRNHMNYFKNRYTQYSFEEITPVNLAEVIEFNSSFNSMLEKKTIIYQEEQDKTMEVLRNYDVYGLIGGLIRVEHNIVAFSIGEKIGDTLFVHIEKANYSYRGAYQMIMNLFSKHFATSDIQFINREEDVGDEGLRNAKKALHPIEILNKYLVMVND